MKLEIPNFSYGDLVNFKGYIERHYLPMLDSLSEPKAEIKSEDRRLLGFLRTDLIEIINDGKELS